MIKKEKYFGAKKVAAVALCVLFAISAIVVSSIIAIRLANAEDVLPIDPSLNAFYDVGDTVDIPNIGLGEDGKTEASPRVYYPDGSVTVGNDCYVSMAGEYTVVYGATADGKHYDKSFTFTAKLPAFSTANGSNAYYGERTKTYKKGYVEGIGSGWEFKYDLENNETYDVTATGIHTELKVGDTFTYNKVIDLAEIDGDAPFVRFGLLPDQSTRDTRFIFFTLTDAYDPTVKMTIQISTGITEATDGPDSWTLYSYVMAKTGTQMQGGLLDDEFKQGYSGDIYGCITWLGMYGNMSGRAQNKEFLSFWYDVEEKQLFAQSLIGKLLVCDFDDPNHFAAPFGGFTTNEVILSVTASDYYTPTLNLYITQIGNDDLSQEYVDFPNPDLTVEVPNEIPNAFVGYEYPLFDAIAKDPYAGEFMPTVKVYSGYGSSAQYDVPVKNNRFVPMGTRKYTAVYTAKSTTGKTTVRTFDINAVPSDGKPLAISVRDDEARFVGETVVLPEPIVTGSDTEVKTEVTVKLNGKAVLIEDGTFKPTDAGDYVVTWAATDIFGRVASESYTVKAIYGDAPIIDEQEVNLPKYFIAGHTYALPTVYAYRYSAEKVSKMKCAVYATGGMLNGNKFTPQSGMSQVSYAAAYNGKSVCVVKDIPIVDVKSDEVENGIDIRKYFVTEGMTLTSSETEITFASANENNRAEFINRFIADGFNAQFTLPASTHIGTRLIVTLADAYSGDAVELAFIRTQSGIALEYNGSQKYVYGVGTPIMISYSREGNAIFATNSSSFELECNPFVSGYLYFSMRLENAFVGSVFAISTLGGQLINNATSDNIRPNIISFEEYAYEYEHGSRISVYPALAADALDPVTMATVTVYRPDRQIAKDIHGIELSSVPADRVYELIADEYGFFNIRYTVTTASGQTRSESYGLNIADKTAPILSVSGAVPKSVKVGETFAVPNCTVSDNVDAAENIMTYCIVHELGTHIMTTCTAGQKYTFERAGEYILRFMAADSSGNVGFVEYMVTAA